MIVALCLLKLIDARGVEPGDLIEREACKAGGRNGKSKNKVFNNKQEDKVSA